MAKIAIQEKSYSFALKVIDRIISTIVKITAESK